MLMPPGWPDWVGRWRLSFVSHASMLRKLPYRIEGNVFPINSFFFTPFFLPANTSMSNVAGKAYAMNLITPMRPSRTWVNRFMFAVGRLEPALLRGLLNLSIIHFARWVVIPRDRWPGIRPEMVPANDSMLFVSNFNGTWDQYIDSFSDGIPNGLNLFWYSSTAYPGSIPITPFKNYIKHNQIGTDYYYNSTPGSAQRDIKSALRIWAGIDVLAQALPTADPEAFALLYARVTQALQNNLAASGPAPIASTDTQKADANRRQLTAKFYATRAASRSLS